MNKKKLISTKMKIFMTLLLIGSIALFSIAGVVLYNSGFKLNNYFNLKNPTLDYFNNHYVDYNKESFSTTSSLNGIENLNLDFNEYITSIETYEGEDIKVSVYPRNSNIQDISSPIIITPDNNTLTIKANTDTLSKVNNNDFEFLIQIPYSYSKNLNINLLSGDISLHNINLLNLTIKSTDSDITLDNLKSESATISVTNGNINTNNSTINKTSFDTVSGDIDLNNASGSVTLSSVNGDIDSTLTDSLTDLSINTTSGDVDLSIANNNNISVSFSSTTGEFEPNISDPSLNNLSIPKSGGSINFALGTGTSKIDVTTVTGDFALSY